MNILSENDELAKLVDGAYKVRLNFCFVFASRIEIYFDKLEEKKENVRHFAKLWGLLFIL